MPWQRWVHTAVPTTAVQTTAIPTTVVPTTAVPTAHSQSVGLGLISVFRDRGRKQLSAPFPESRHFALY